MKRTATVTETVTYRIEFDVPDNANEDDIEEAAGREWEANPGRKPVDYECSIEIQGEMKC